MDFNKYLRESFIDDILDENKTKNRSLKKNSYRKKINESISNLKNRRERAKKIRKPNRTRRKLNESIIQTNANVITTAKARTKLEEGSEVVIDRPKDSDIKNSGIDCSDYANSAYMLYSQLLYDMGIIPKVYHSTNVILRKSTSKDIFNLKQIINSFLSTFKPNDPIEFVHDALDKSEANMTAEIGYSVKMFFSEPGGSAKLTWDKLTDVDYLMKVISPYVRGKLGSDSAKTNRNALKQTVNYISSIAGRETLDRKFNKSEATLDSLKTKTGIADGVNDDIDNNTEYNPSDEEVSKVKEVVQYYYDVFKDAKSSGVTVQLYEKRVISANSLNTKLRESFADDVKELFNEDETGTVGTLLETANGILDEMSKDSGAVKGHIYNIVQDEEVSYFSRIVEQTGNRLTPQSFINYQKKNYPDFLSNMKYYGLSESDLSDFKNWKDITDYFYTPESIVKINERFGSKRIKDAKSAKQNVDLRAVKIREENLKKRLTKSDISVDMSKLSDEEYFNELRKRYESKVTEVEEARIIRDELKAEVRANPDDEVILSNYEKAKQLAFSLGKAADALRLQIKKGVRKSGVRGRKKIENKLTKVQREAIELTKEILDDDKASEVATDELRKEHNKKENEIIDDFGSDYLTYSFDLYKTSLSVAEKFSKFFCKIMNSLSSSGDDYINEFIDYNGEDGFTVYIDYPENSELNKKLSKNKNNAYGFIDQIINAFNKKYKTRLSYDEESVKYGKSIKDNSNDDLDSYWDE